MNFNLTPKPPLFFINESYQTVIAEAEFKNTCNTVWLRFMFVLDFCRSTGVMNAQIMLNFEEDPDATFPNFTHYFDFLNEILLCWKCSYSYLKL